MNKRSYTNRRALMPKLYLGRMSDEEYERFRAEKTEDTYHKIRRSHVPTPRMSEREYKEFCEQIQTSRKLRGSYRKRRIKC